MFYNDHGLNFFLDKMPTFAVGAAAEYNNADEGWGIPTLPPLQGQPGPVLAPDQQLVAKEFDVVTCQEMLVDHACTLPLKLFWPEGSCAGGDRADQHQHRAVSAAHRRASTAWARPWATPSVPGTAKSAWP
jgi:hypothetical protein